MLCNLAHNLVFLDASFTFDIADLRIFSLPIRITIDLARVTAV
jgi:hypothetical protein